MVWSAHSVESDWVKEEASLARKGGKYLPVQIDETDPPIGFSRIQAAQLSGWSGDQSNAQWQLLVREVRNLAGGQGAPQRQAPRPPAAPEAGARKAWPARLGVIGVLALVAVIAFLALREPTPEPYAPALAISEAFETSETSPDPALVPAPDPAQHAEIERLRQERDAALESERQQRAEAERLRNERAASSAPGFSLAAPPAATYATLAGVWTLCRQFTTPATEWETSGTLTFSSDGSFSCNTGNPGTWTQNGAGVRFTCSTGRQTAYVGTISGDRVTGTMSNNDSQHGNFELTR